MAERLAQQALSSCGLPALWADSNAWTVLDTDFQNAGRFLATWLAWQRDPQRPRMLHYVGIAQAAPVFTTANNPATDADQPKVFQILVQQCAALGPGFHRIVLEGARISLTLCIGADVQTLLGEHVFQADTVFAGQPQDKWAVQLLARRCKRGSRFCIAPDAPTREGALPPASLPTVMQAAGFQLDEPVPSQSGLTGSFNPRWDIATSRSASPHVVQRVARCAVIGAGIAGASVAHALALRGWQVSVFDQEIAPAGGASGLPAGLAVPHVSADDNPRSRLSRSGTRLLMQHAERMLQRGQDWEPSGVMEQRPDAPPLWHAHACWIKPAALVRAWLAQPGIRFVGQSTVGAINRNGDLWQVRGADGQDLGNFEIVVAANALACTGLLKGLPANAQPRSEILDKLAALQAVHGTLSHGSYAEPLPKLPATPVNGNGCFIPHVPGAGGEQWFAGSTFETDAMAAADIGAQHAANMVRLRQLLPMAGFDLAETLDRGPVAQWSATRCVTHDRLPLVGPIETASGTGLWLCVGMGSRGLSFSGLCAELLVARLGAEPLPVEFSLSRSLDVNRVRRRQSFASGDESPSDLQQ
ncbi:MAG: FAD-dependent oxidoreductase [Pseudomonadota bacterium]